MGGRFSNGLIEENKNLKKKKVSTLENLLQQVKDQTTKLVEELCRDKFEYESVRDFALTWQTAHPRGIVFKEVTAIIGPKGSGKSTYLWMRIPAFPKPEKSYGNGNSNLQILQEHGFMDTIGIMNLIRLLVLFLVHEAVPMNAIFCQNDRIERTIAVLTHMCITKYYVLAMDVTYLHRYYASVRRFVFNPDINFAFDEEAYAAWNSRNENCRRCDAQTHVPINPLLNTFEKTFEFLFPLKKVGIVPYETFSSKRKEDQNKKNS